MMISLRCEDCLGTMEVDESREVLTCPYCGSKKMLPVSDTVKIRKMEIEHEEIEKAERRKAALKVLIGCVLLIFFALFMCIALSLLG